MHKLRIGFMGAGGIARVHAYSLQALKYYYNDIPELILESVTSAGKESRQNFAKKFGFTIAESLEKFISNKKLEAVFILSPNKIHSEHIKFAFQMPEVKYIYLEKPVCSTLDEELNIKKLTGKLNNKKKIQVGFQYLQTPAIREALMLWRSGKFGKPLHFDFKYYHGDYLKSDYRNKRTARLTPAPEGGAMADLGSHIISLLIAFVGEKLQITGASQAGSFRDVPKDSDLFSSLQITEKNTKATGTLSASRISPGTGDLIYFEIYAENGGLRYYSNNPEYFEYCFQGTNEWIRHIVGSNYNSLTSFPSAHVTPGWLRSMVHAHYIFFTENDPCAFIPGIDHGLAVQKIVRETADHLSVFRKKIAND